MSFSSWVNGACVFIAAVLCFQTAHFTFMFGENVPLNNSRIIKPQPSFLKNLDLVGKQLESEVCGRPKLLKKRRVYMCVCVCECDYLPRPVVGEGRETR